MNAIDKVMLLHYDVIEYVRIVYFGALLLLLVYSFFKTDLRLCVGLFCISAAISLYQSFAIVLLRCFKEVWSKDLKHAAFLSSAILDYVDLCLYFAVWVLLIKYLISVRHHERKTS